MKLNVCLLQPSGYIHSLALLEVAEYLVYLAKENGHEASLTKNRLIHGRINIVFGAHINPKSCLELPLDTIIFNTEQLTEDSVWTSTDYKDILCKHYVFDYSEINLTAIPHQNKGCVELLYSKSLKRVDEVHTKKYDLLFYGVLNEKRTQLLEKLASYGLRVHHIAGVYSKERDAALAHTRAVLNLHFYESKIFQQIRAFYPLINGIPVISENFPHESAPAIYKDVIFTPRDQPFVEFVVNLLKNKEGFQKLTEKKIELFKNTSASEDFEILLQSAASLLTSDKEPKRDSKRINLGSGKDYKFGYLNIDIREEVHPDVVFDLGQPVTFPLHFESIFTGEITIDENEFEEIVANDVLEHVPDLERLMGNCLKLLKVGGQFKINVPYDLSLGAWQVPTHIRGFNQNSWLYYTDWFWYLGWYEHRFELTELTYIPSQMGKDLLQQGIPEARVIDTPRAIDSMAVTLTKRITTPAERDISETFRSDVFLIK